MIRRRRWICFGAALALLVACEGTPRNADWNIVYPDAESAAREAALAVEIREGDCDGMGAVRYFAEFRPGETPVPPPVLEPGVYSLRAEARDVDCSVFVRGCSEVELPFEEMSVAVVLDSVLPEEPACGALTCIGGLCGPPPGVDVGPMDAGDTGVVDTSVTDTGRDTRPADVGPTDWWDTGWSHRHRLSFDNSGQAENLDDFPVLVALNSSRVDYGDIRDGGQDLRFVSSDGTTELAYEIEDYDESGNSYVWVRVPRIASRSTSEHIWLYYGNGAAGSGANAAAVWSAGYAAVWHLNNSPNDSTSNDNDGAPTDVPGTAARIAGGGRWNGTTSAMDVPADPSIANVFDGGGTISAFIRPDSFGGSGFGRVLDKSTDRLATSGWAWQLASGSFAMDTLRLERDFSTNNGFFNAPTGSVGLGSWQYVALTYDDSATSNVPAMYIDGSAVTVSVSSMSGGPSGSAISDAAVALRVGGVPGATTRGFDGLLDELRISTRIRSAAWIAAQQLSLTDALITYGASERP